MLSQAVAVKVITMERAAKEHSSYQFFSPLQRNIQLLAIQPWSTVDLLATFVLHRLKKTKIEKQEQKAEYI